MGFREELDNLFKSNKKLTCEITKINKNSEYGILSIDSIVSDETGKVVLNYTDKTGNKFIETNLYTLNIKYNVKDYNELLTINSSQNALAYVRESQGTKWLPGTLGGNFYPAGLYFWSGNSWVKDDTDIYNQLQSIINALSTLETGMKYESTQW